jgi:imidazolonepropionase-like amidohydrolase
MSKILVVGTIASVVTFAQTHAITNARIVPVTTPAIERGTIVIRDGKIAAVGNKVAVPAGANKIDGTGLSVYPGWIDAYSSVGLIEISSVKGSVDTTELGPFNPQAQAWIAVNPHSEMIRTARANGVTGALVSPSGGLISGVASAINLSGNYPNEMALSREVGVVINIPSIHKRAPRGAERGAAPETPEARGTRVEQDLAKLKQYLREAKAYAEMKARLGKKPNNADDLALDAMVPVMRGEKAAIFPADHFRDIQAAVKLADEFGMKAIIAGGADAWKVADLLKQKNVAVLYTEVHALPREREDPYDAPFTTPEVLRRAGVRFAIASGSSEDNRNLPYRAAMAAAYGLEREEALKAITQWPAEILGIADRVGSLEAGKLANLLVSRGDPLDARTEIKYVFIEGKLVPLESRNTELYERFIR